VFMVPLSGRGWAALHGSPGQMLPDDTTNFAEETASTSTGVTLKSYTLSP